MVPHQRNYISSRAVRRAGGGVEKHKEDLSCCFFDVFSMFGQPVQRERGCQASPFCFCALKKTAPYEIALDARELRLKQKTQLVSGLRCPVRRAPPSPQSDRQELVSRTKNNTFDMHMEIQFGLYLFIYILGFFYSIAIASAAWH